MLSRNASISTSIKEEDSSRGENGDKSQAEQPEGAEQAKLPSKPGLAITDELRTNIQRKWLGR
jgi:hypothetical protein